MIREITQKVLDLNLIPGEIWNDHPDLYSMQWNTFVEWTLEYDSNDKDYLDDPVDDWIRENYPELNGTEFLIYRH